MNYNEYVYIQNERIISEKYKIYATIVVTIMLLFSLFLSMAKLVVPKVNIYLGIQYLN